MNQFGAAVKNLFSSENDLANNNILETAHHSNTIFEKIDTDKYFSIKVSEIDLNQLETFRTR